MTVGILTIFFFIYTIEQFWRLFYPAGLEPAVAQPQPPSHDDHGHGSESGHGGHTHVAHSPQDHGHTDHGHGGHGAGHDEPEETPRPLSPAMAALQGPEGTILLKFILAIGLGVPFGAQALGSLSGSECACLAWTVFIAAAVLVVSGCVNMWRDVHRAAAAHATE